MVDIHKIVNKKHAKELIELSELIDNSMFIEQLSNEAFPSPTDDKHVRSQRDDPWNEINSSFTRECRQVYAN